MPSLLSPSEELEALEAIQEQGARAFALVRAVQDAADDAVEALIALRREAEAALTNMPNARPAFWSPVLDEARAIARYIDHNGDGSCFDFQLLVDDADDLVTLLAFAIEQTRKRVRREEQLAAGTFGDSDA